MIFPHTIAVQDKESGLRNWEKQFLENGRHVHEGIWRRTQSEKNKTLSGWKSDKDARWRVVHFVDEYDAQINNKSVSLVLRSCYLKINHALPEKEASELLKRYMSELDAAEIICKDEKGITTCNIGGLNLSIRFVDGEKSEKVYGIKLPSEYKIIDVEVSSQQPLVTEPRKMFPWEIIKKGFREVGTRGKPKYYRDIKNITQYLPAQIELGCGPSTEVGIPPLSYLHNVYQTTGANGKYIFGDNDDLFLSLIKNPEGFYNQATKIMSSSWTSRTTTPFYQWLKRAHASTLVVGPIITNNYDGLTSILGIQEKYIRKFDDDNLIPQVDFHPLAKSLLVVGVHADRRCVQRAARSRGLKVIFVDPENYIDDDGAFFEYPIEAPTDEDIVLRMTASDFGRKMLEEGYY